MDPIMNDLRMVFGPQPVEFLPAAIALQKKQTKNTLIIVGVITLAGVMFYIGYKAGKRGLENVSSRGASGRKPDDFDNFEDDFDDEPDEPTPPKKPEANKTPTGFDKGEGVSPKSKFDFSKGFLGNCDPEMIPETMRPAKPDPNKKNKPDKQLPPKAD